MLLRIDVIVIRAMGGVIRLIKLGPNFSFPVLFILLLEIQGCCCSLNSEGLALLGFREGIDYDPYGSLANWNANDSNPCGWRGVNCLDGKVQHINLSNLSLEGFLSPHLGNLTHLKSLVLSNNSFSGTIPKEIGILNMLQLLDLRNNNLNGPIPLELTRSTSLKILLVYSNNNMVESPPILCLNPRSPHCLKEYKRRHYLPTTSIHNIQVRIGSARRRHLLQQSNIASNAGQTSVPNQIVYVPISRSSGSFPAIPKAININPNVGPTNNGSDQKRLVGGNTWKYVVTGLALLLLITVVVMIFISRSKAVKTIVPWKTGLSGQLQKAFVTGVPKLNRGELESACEEFSNIIDTNGSTLYKGTLSSGVEIAVTSTAIAALKYWSKRSQRAYRKKIDMLSRINHKNFVNLIGYCEEDQPFTRMMVFEYAPNGSLSEHLHVKEVEHLDWGTRIRIIMGTSYCLQHMHGLSPPVAHPNLNANNIFLTDDYAAKIADIGFGQESSKNPGEDESELSELTASADPESNVYSFGIMLLEIISGKSPYEEGGYLSKWAIECLNGKQSINNVIDPALKSFKNVELNTVSDVIRMCGQSDSKKRPGMKEVIAKLKETIAITPEQAVPRLSPLWWAELEILSAESA